MANQSTEGADGQNKLHALNEHLADLKKQNELLRLETEISYLERALSYMPQPQPFQTSTPMPSRAGPSITPRRLVSDMPKGRPEKTDQDLSDDRPDRFVTVRKRQLSPVTKSRGTFMKPATFDGTVAWLDYKAHFDACAELNGWSTEQKGLYLSVSLRGQAQGVFGNLGPGKHDYDQLVRALEERFAPPNQTELYRVQLRERRQKASETMAELGQDIRRLTNLAYPKAPADVRETLAMEQFVDTLVNSEMRLKIKQARPADLNDAVRHAVELEAFYRAEQKHLGQGMIQATAPAETKTDSGWKEAFSSLNKSMEEMTKTMNKLLSQQQQKSRTSRNDGENKSSGHQQFDRRPKRKCFICGSEKHLQRNCPKKRNDERSHDKRSDSKSMSMSGSSQAGLFVEANIVHHNIDCLVDTGATLTVLSTKIWSLVKGSDSLSSFDREIVSASGDPLDVKGKTKIPLDINGISCVTECVVAEIDVDMILGLDFMLDHNVVVDVVKLNISINDKPCPVSKAGRMGCHRVVVSEKTVVPPRSEMIIEGKLVSRDSLGDDMGMLESSEKFLSSNRGIVARTLVLVDDKIPIRYANFSHEEQVIYPGTNIATFSPVQVVSTAKASQPKVSNHLPHHLTDLYERSSEGMTKTQKKDIAKLLRKYSDTFSKSDHDLGRTGIIKHKISTENVAPIKQPMRRVPVHMQDEVDHQLDEMLDNGIIQPSTSPWSSAIVLVQKKDGSKRFCIDYRRLNDVTLKDAYPLPRIDESIDQLAGSKWFSCLDLSSGYWQVEVDPEDKQKTAFTTRRGLFEFNVMPFGLCNAPATFERLMETVLSGLHWQICLIYLDDIIVFGKSFDEMVKNLDLVL